jgi:hypothetical protein
MPASGCWTSEFLSEYGRASETNPARDNNIVLLVRNLAGSSFRVLSLILYDAQVDVNVDMDGKRHLSKDCLRFPESLAKDQPVLKGNIPRFPVRTFPSTS